MCWQNGKYYSTYSFDSVPRYPEPRYPEPQALACASIRRNTLIRCCKFTHTFTLIYSIVITCTGCTKPQGILFPQLQQPMVWPNPPNEPRIQWIGKLSNSNDLHAEQPWLESFKSVFRGPRPPIRFTGPHDIAIRSPGILAVTDSAGRTVHLIDLQNRTHKVISGFDQEYFDVPICATWAGNRLFITDAGRHEIIELDDEGLYRNRFGKDQLQHPVGIAYVKQRNELFVVDGHAHHIAVFDLDGNLITTMGSRGIKPGQFNYPSHICVKKNQMLVSDSGNFRVQLLDINGQYISSIGKQGNAAGDFALPKGVAMDSEGHIYVVDARFENIQVFNQQGQLLMVFGQEGINNGKFSLPAGLTIDNQNRIWVCDSANKRLQVFGYLRKTP